MLTAILLDRGINFASEPANEPKSFGRWTYSKMDVALNVDVVLLDIGRSVLKPFFLSSHLPRKIPEYLRWGHVHCHRNILPFLPYPTYQWSADSCEAEGTVCPISFVKDVLVRTLTGYCIPSPSLLWPSCRQSPYHGNFQSPPSSDSPVGFRYSDQSDQTLVLASAVAIFMYRCKRPEREEETSIFSLSYGSPATAQSVAILQPSSQAFLIRHNKHLFLNVFGCRRWEHSSGTRRVIRHPEMQLAAS
jgi:hypothetical protein